MRVCRRRDETADDSIDLTKRSQTRDGQQMRSRGVGSEKRRASPPPIDAPAARCRHFQTPVGCLMRVNRSSRRLVLVVGSCGCRSFGRLVAAWSLIVATLDAQHSARRSHRLPTATAVVPRVPHALPPASCLPTTRYPLHRSSSPSSSTEIEHAVARPDNDERLFMLVFLASCRRAIFDERVDAHAAVVSEPRARLRLSTLVSRRLVSATLKNRAARSLTTQKLARASHRRRRRRRLVI